MQLTALVALGLAALAAADIIPKVPAHLGDGYSPKRIRQPKDKKTCEDKRQAAVHVCEVYPRSGECTGLRDAWKGCIDKSWGYELKKQ